MQPGILDEGGMIPTAPPIPVEELKTEKELAQFASTKEFKRLEQHFQERIEFYQSYLPDGRPVTAAPVTSEQWAIANGVIGELKLVLNTYLNAAEVVKDARRD